MLGNMLYIYIQNGGGSMKPWYFKQEIRGTITHMNILIKVTKLCGRLL